MAQPAPNPELLPSLGKLARGLSALFWGLPMSLILSFQTAATDWLRPFGLLPVGIALSLLIYGLTLMGSFQKQERPWRLALDRARLIALVNLGLCPFLYWWGHVPDQSLFSWAVGLLMVTGILFLMNLNLVLARLAAMLPDETLRQETRQFTALNRTLLVLLLAAFGGYLLLPRISGIPMPVIATLAVLERYRWVMLVPLLLLPLAMTMALIWKTKEVILESVFGGKH